MKEVGVLEATADLSSLIDAVRAGEHVVITRDGEPVAKLVAVESPQHPDRKAAVAAIRALRDEIERKYGIDEDFDWKAAVNEGRP